MWPAVDFLNIIPGIEQGQMASCVQSVVNLSDAESVATW